MNKYSPLSSKETNANKLYEYVFAPDGFLKGILGHPVFHTKIYALEKPKGYFGFYTYKYFLHGKVLLEYSQKIVFFSFSRNRIVKEGEHRSEKTLHRTYSQIKQKHQD